MMYDKFIQAINELYSLILQPIDNVYKTISVKKCKKIFNTDNDNDISHIYYSLKGTDKEKGAVYTPFEIAEFMIENTINCEEIINNPYLKILDPACGSGNLIIPCFKYLKNIFTRNLDEINRINNLHLKEADLGKHIISNNLFGFDIDETALKVLIIELFEMTGHVEERNFQIKDFLIEDNPEKFNFFIGNPPYIGHKTVDREYSKLLKERFKGIYKDKGDISYCFFKKSIEALDSRGKITFITSRYFLESPSGEELRKTLKNETEIYKIVDFYGIRPFKKAGIDPVILFMNHKDCEEKELQVIKPLNNIGKEKHNFYKSLFLKQGEEYKSFFINSRELKDEGWSLINKEEKNIVEKIEKKSSETLGDLCNSYQGIITGCDKAFVVDASIIKENNLEKDIIRPWIKSSCINKNEITSKDMYIIYSNLIDDEDKYPNAIKYIKNHEEKLLNRRECKKGIRKWYQLQWGRNMETFEQEKIIFPYKSNKNNFALDKGSYFSADVYSLMLKQGSSIDYNYLLYILNSSIYEFYFKTFAKKLGENLFEYYPNNLMKLKIPIMDTWENHDECLYDFFNLTKKEVEIINNICI